MSHGTVQVQWHPTFVQCWKLASTVELPRYKHSGSKRHCTHKIERDSCKSQGDNFSFDVDCLLLKKLKKKKKDEQMQGLLSGNKSSNAF